MPTTHDPLFTYRLAETVETCVKERVSRTIAGAPNRSVIVTGEIAHDDCECGLLTVAIQQDFLTNSFPEEQPGAPVSSALPCGGGQRVIGLLVSMHRCSPNEAQTDDPPAVADLKEAARASVEDVWQIRNGLKCCLSELATTNDPATNGRHITNFQIGTTTYVGAQGYCQGSETPVLIAVLNSCADCDDGDS